ncbi:MAG: 16S rRNA (uracil(1498)-N(3))-methyltransferase [Oceanococcus sp.]
MAHIPRIHWPESLLAGQQLSLSGERAHHLLRVLKRKTGDPLTLFQSDCEFDCCISSAEKSQLSIDVLTQRAVQRESPLHTVLIQSLSRGDKMDFTVQKAVELGVSAIQPVISQRGGVQLDAKRLEKKQAHWQAVALSAAEQSGRTVIPQVLPCEKLETYLSEQAPLQGFLLAPDSERLDAAAPENAKALHILVGPEGGLSEHEINLAQRAGLKATGLGPRVFRTETAGLAALSVIQWLWGDLA